MKKKICNVADLRYLWILSLFLLFSCEKKAKSEPVMPAQDKWVVVYRDVMLGDQNNTKIGQFLKTQTGEVKDIALAFSEQGYMSMMYFSEYGNNRLYLTFPGNAYSEAFSKEDEENNLFNRAGVGLNYWEAANLNSGEITHAATLDQDMSKAEFEALASGLQWSEFDVKFRAYNSGDADLSFVAGAMGPENGSVYMLQLNNAIRAFIYIKNVIPGSASGGSVQFDMVIEGSGAYNSDPSTKRVNPAKD